MIMWNSRTDCHDARLYYYDILHQESPTDLPSEMLLHVSACDHCQSEIARLESMLDDIDGPSKAVSHRDSSLLQLLRLHFSYADKPVTCSIVKPFLPSMADDRVRIRIPTPITTHIDQCESCSGDLRALGGLSGTSFGQMTSGKQAELAAAKHPDMELSSGAREGPGAPDPRSESPVPQNGERTVSRHCQHLRCYVAESDLVKKGAHLLTRHLGKIAAALAMLVFTNGADRRPSSAGRICQPSK